MKSTLITRVVAGALVATTAFLSTSYLLGQSAPAPTATAPAASQAGPKILAEINGQKIDTDRFNDLLRSVAGMRVLEQVIDLMVVEQFCRTSGINIDGPEFEKNVKAELDRALAGINAPEGVTLTEAQRNAALAQILQQRGITPVEFQMGLRKGACLRALAQGKVTVTDKMVENAYKAQYGERLNGRVFVVAADMKESSDIRNAIVKDGKDIEEVARTHNGQKLTLPMEVEFETPATTPAAPAAQPSIYQKLKDACVAVKATDKQFVGPVQQPIEKDKPATFVLFYVEKKDASKLATTTLDSVKDKLRKDLQEQGEVNFGNLQLQRLRIAANIKINDPILSQQYEDIINRMKAAETQAATRNATMPGTTAPATMK